MIKAQVIADSENKFGNRITTMVVTFPRIILAELNTHRMMSRNSASSRAIPFEKMLKSVEENPFIPIAWQKDHKGMQGSEYLEGQNEGEATEQWLIARDGAVKQALILSGGNKLPNPEGGLNVTKQLCNRLLEPFMYHTVLITATEWENFFVLRCPQYSLKGTEWEQFYNVEPKDSVKEVLFRSKKDALKYYQGSESFYYKDLVELDWLKLNKGQAEIHMMALAEAVWDAMNESVPVYLRDGEWHIPFKNKMDSKKIEKFAWIENKERNLSPLETEIAISTARCARVSYTVVGEEGKPPNYENDIKLHDRLAASGHWSPFEHCAQAMEEDDTLRNATYPGQDCKYPDGWSGNFKGFIQYRKQFTNENITNK